MKEILVVDDEKEITDLIELYLHNEDYNINKFYDAETALAFLKQNHVDLAILDLMLPGIDGFKLCELIRESFNFPIIMLTARDEEIDKLKGLSIGADDYITKPFKPLELVARVKAQLRRYINYNKAPEENSILSLKGLSIDTKKYLVYLNENKLDLTPTEFEILKYLVENKNKVVKTDELFRVVWKDKYFTSSNNTVMVHIRHLRKKMGDSFESPHYIKTVWGVGYKVEE